MTHPTPDTPDVASSAIARMPFDDPHDAPRSDDQSALDRIREAFTAADYTVDGVNRLLGDAAAEALHRDLLAPAFIALARSEEDADEGVRALAALVRLFLLADEAEAGAVPAVADLVAMGLVEETGGGRVRALVDVRPYATAGGASSDEAAGEGVEAASAGVDMWVASDLGGVQLGRERALRRDHVVGIGPATTLLAQLTPRDGIRRALDLGVGMGVQTMHLLSHVDHVVATDISLRAIAFARFNLLLNAPALGIRPEALEERVSLRVGNLLEPVAGESFDLVVSNPPFVITPRRSGEGASDQYTYRDGGLEGDRIVRDLVSGLGDVLAPEGLAIMLGNWEVHEGDATWHSRVESWPAADVDAWIVRREDATPVEYADMWLKDAAENAELTTWRGAFERYLEDFSERGVESVGMGMLFLRKHGGERAAAEGGAMRAADVFVDGSPLRRFEHLTHQLEQPLGPVLRAAWDRVEWLRDRSDEDLLDETLLVAPDVTEERHATPGAEHPSVILLRQGGGFRRTFPLTSELAGFVSVCDGDLTGAQIVPAIASLIDADADALAADLAPRIRELVALGFLVPRWM